MNKLSKLKKNTFRWALKMPTTPSIAISNPEGKKIAALNIGYENLSFRPGVSEKDKNNLLDTYFQFLIHLKNFLDQANYEKIVWERYKQKAGSYYKKEIEEKKLDEFFTDIEIVRYFPRLGYGMLSLYLYKHVGVFFEMFEHLGPEFLLSPSCQQIVQNWI